MRILKIKRLLGVGILLTLVQVLYFANLGLKSPETETITYEPIRVRDEEVEALLPRPKATLIIESEPEPEIQAEEKFLDISSEDEMRLLKIAMVEARVDGVEGMGLVMRVVLNRVESDLFPDTIDEVIHQKNQFSTVTSGKYDEAVPDEACYEALELIEQGEYQSMTALFFDSCQDSWASRNREFSFKFGGHKFYE